MLCKGDAVRVAAASLVAAALPPSPMPPPVPVRDLRSGKLPLPAEATEVDEEIEVDLREVYFLIMHFLRSGPCERATGQLWNELLQHKLLPRRYHGFFSRNGTPTADENDDGLSFPLSYAQVAERHKNVDNNHLVKLLQQLLVHDKSASLLDAKIPKQLTAADVPTLLGSGAFSLLESEQSNATSISTKRIEQMRWPHWQADQVHALAFRELGGGFAKHHRPPSTRTVKHVIIKPSVLVNRIRIIQVLRGHRNAVYCAVFDRTGRYLVTGSDDRLVKIWSVENRLCLRSCRGHEGDITDLSVSSSNTLVASASNDSSIRVWGLPDGVPVAILRGHTAGVTAIKFSPRPGCEHHLLSSSEDGTCRIWDARDSSVNSRVYMPKPDSEPESAGAENRAQVTNQILCCAFNADGSYFVTGSSDKLARVWDARKWADEYTGMPNHEHDILSGHENVVNYVQFSGCAEPIKVSPLDFFKDDNVPDNIPKFKTTWFPQDSIVTCSRDGSAIIWSPRPRKQLKLGRWVKAYHLKVPPPPMPQPPVRTGGPRQKLLPTPRGVNMIVWSLDNRFVLAAIMDCRICVWNAVDGSLVHCLTGHTKQTYVLDVHPCNPRIAMSAGYDGRVIVWDIWEGRPVRTFETGDYNLVDGNFSPDGTSLVVSDEVGQVYLFSTGVPSQDEDDSKYDQFFLGDYRPLVRDTHGNVLDQETQLPPHQRNLQDLLCDASLIPYPEPYQSSYQQRRLGLLGCYWQPPSVQLAVGTYDDPAFIPQDQPQAVVAVLQANEHTNEQGNRWVEQPADGDAMDWDEEVTGLSDDSGSDYCASEESSSDEDGNEESGTICESETTDKEIDEIDSDGIRTRRTRKKNREILATLVRKQKRRRLEESNNALLINEETQRLRSTKRIRKSNPEHALRPMRVAARNALTMFSSLHEYEDDEARRLAAENTEMPGPSGENENQRLLRNGKVLSETQEHEDDEPPPPKKSPAETSDVGECRRPRSQRKLVLKLRNCSQRSNNEHPSQSLEIPEQDTSKLAEAEVNDSHPREADGFVEGENPTEAVSSDDKLGYVWKKGKAAKRARLPYHSSSSEEDKMVDLPPDTKEGLQVARVENGDTKVLARAAISESESERSLSADYHDEEQRREQNQTLTSNESLQNGEAPDGDNDPDYDEEVSPASNSDEDAYKPEEEQASEDLDLDPDDIQMKRKMNKAVYSRRRPRKVATKTESYEADEHASGGRRRSTRLAQGRVVSLSNRRSTRSRRNAGRPSHWEASSSYDMDDDSDWDRSSDDDGRRKSERRTSTRLKVKLQKNVGSRYKDFHVKRNHNTVHRNPSNVSWLLLTEVERTRYIPQFGDEVVYFRQGHQDYLDNKQLDDDGPWRSLKRELQAVEFCEIVGLDHVILEETGNTCCRLTLEFMDGYRIRGSSFSVDLPELTDFADFIVERSRYEASMARKWSSRDKCQVWWRSDEEDGGRWWEGTITQVKAKSPEFPNSPWDSISVLYKDEPSTTNHCPWELHDVENPLTWEPPQIEQDKVRELLDIVDEVLHSNQSKDEYGLWRLQQAVSKPDFLDRIALPISMDVIRERLENNYYRSLMAVSHDLRILIENFRTYFGKQHSSVLKVERLRERFSDALEM